MKTTESGGPRGFDAGKKIKGRKRHIFADGAYAGDKLRGAMAALGDWTFEIIKRSDTAKGFAAWSRTFVHACSVKPSLPTTCSLVISTCRDR